MMPADTTTASTTEGAKVVEQILGAGKRLDEDPGRYVEHAREEHRRYHHRTCGACRMELGQGEPCRCEPEGTIARLTRELEEARNLFQRTHGVHWSWVQKATEAQAAERARDTLADKAKRLKGWRVRRLMPNGETVWSSLMSLPAARECARGEKVAAVMRTYRKAKAAT
jgi:hypothetical protein